ncbi:MFS transporter [Streptomyces sp. NPDC059382]|uniref:MFS transporter n=1 Tax=Streptomyces sp. NPDC059382 TaxID=3346816 RepID=UPI0036C3138F
MAFRGLLVVRLLGALAGGVMLPFVILWAHRVGGLSGAAAGTLFLVQAVGEFTGGLVGGALADRIGHRRMLLLSTTGMALGYGSLFLVHQPVPALGLFLAAGLFESAFHPTIAALIGDLHADEDLPHAYGLTRVVASVGGVVGPILGAAAVALSLSGVFAVAGVLLSITFTWWQADGLVLLNQVHPLNTTAYATLFVIDALAIILFQIPVSRWTRRRDIGRMLFLGAALQGVGLAGFAAAGLGGYPVLVAAVLVVSLGMMISGPTTSAFITRYAPPGRSATYQAALSTTQDIGAAIGPTSGLALGRIGAPALVWISALPLGLLAGLATARAAGPPSRPDPHTATAGSAHPS